MVVALQYLRSLRLAQPRGERSKFFNRSYLGRSQRPLSGNTNGINTACFGSTTARQAGPLGT